MRIKIPHPRCSCKIVSLLPLTLSVREVSESAWGSVQERKREREREEKREREKTEQEGDR